MKALKSLNLVVGAVVVASFIVLTATMGWYQYQDQKRQDFDDAMFNLRTVLLTSQARLETEFARQDLVDVEREVTALKLLDDVELSAVIDELGIVRYSSNFLILDQPASSQLPQFDAAIFARVKRSDKPELVSDESRNSIFAYYPVVLGASPNSIRPDRIGLLYVKWNMRRAYALTGDNMLRELIYMTLLIVIVVSALLLLLRRMVVQPVQRLKQKAEAIASGQDVNSFQTEGIAEIRDLSYAVNRMNRKLCAGISDVKRSEERWLFALEGAGDGVLDFDYRTRNCYFSAQLRRLLGLAENAELKWEDWQQQIHPEDWPYVERRMQRHMQGLSDYFSVEYRLVSSSKDYRYILMRGKVVEWAADGNPARLISTHSEITSRRHMENALRTSEEKYRRLFEMAQEGIWVIDAEGNTTIVNNAMANMLGYKKEEMMGRHLFDFMDDDARSQAEKNMKRRVQGLEEQHDFELLSKTGRRVFTTMQTAPLYDENGNYSGAIAGVMDITERKRAEERVRQQVLFDDLTRLPNRRMLNEKLSQEQARALRHDHVGALLFIDLDHFKNVNDSLGHPIGDSLLVAIADRLRKVVREEDTLARLGGDEFVVLLPELSDDPSTAASHARNAALKLQSALLETFDVSGYKLNIGCSIGIALYPLDQDTIHDIMKQADAAMYRAKEEGRNTICLFSKEMHEEIEQNLRLQMLLPGALQEEQFELYFQGQFNEREELIGAEVLLRWREPTLGFVRPDQFIRAAEESGFIVTLGDWVLRRACQQLHIWRQQGLPDTFERLAINISARQFGQDDFAQRVFEFTREEGVDPHQIELEITESMLLNRLELVVAKMHLLHDMGFYIALDDFGTGYSSLSYLRSLPLHKLKIDQAFVRDIQNDRNDRAIVETIIAMARHMELEVIAEGVEEEYQLNFLKQNGCQQYQGYYFAKPVPATEFFETWIQAPECKQR